MQTLPALLFTTFVDPATWMEFSGLAAANRVLGDVEKYVLAKQWPW